MFYSLLLALAFHAFPAKNIQRLPATIVIPASDFLYDLPKGNIMINADGQEPNWLFNNTGLQLRSETNMMKTVTVPEDGRYTLYVRSVGNKGASFMVAVNDKISSTRFGDTAMRLEKGGIFDLKKGTTNVKITRIDPGSVVDVIVLSKEPLLSEQDIYQLQLNPDVQLFKEFKIPERGVVKFGDLNGDSRTDLVVLARDFSAYAIDNSGRELWRWKAPDTFIVQRSEFEAPGVIWDFDKDGKAELIHWRQIDDKEYLVMADGATGQIKKQIPWPTKPLPHVYNNFRLAIAKLTTGAPNELVVFTDMGGTININAYDANLQPLWQHTEEKKKDHLGHYIYPVDLNNDGVDEVLVGSLLLDAKGKQVWNRFDLLFDNHDHADSYKFGDVNGDGKTDIVTANSETGVFIYEAMTGKIIWQQVAEHSQQIQVGNFLKGYTNPQVVVGGRTYGNRQANESYLNSQLYWFDNKGNMLFKWPGNPLNGNPDFVKGKWDGVNDQLFWYKFKINDKGKGEFYFPSDVYHMFDFLGTGAEQVITMSPVSVRVYGSKNAKYSNKDMKKDPMYLKNTVVNHTHY